MSIKMMDFKARLPKGKPEKGTAFIVVSIKDDEGNRAEFDGAIDKERACKILGDASGIAKLANSFKKTGQK